MPLPVYMIVTDSSFPILDSGDAAREQAMLDSANIESEGATSDDVDEARVAHDEAAVRTVYAQAIKKVEELGIAMTQKERETALGLFPKVSILSISLSRYSC